MGWDWAKCCGKAGLIGLHQGVEFLDYGEACDCSQVSNDHVLAFCINELT